ncbi:MAG TPA: hypothetical protein VH639_10725 [Bryobacteraceae bacterium]|jgi:hypothetical protein
MPARCSAGERGAPFVEVYADAPGSAILRAAALTDAAIKQATSAGLAKERIACVEENAVLPGAEDWVYIRLSKVSQNPASPLRIEMSVRNGAAVTYQIITWQGRRSKGGSRQEILDGIASLIADLGKAYGSPSYRKGRTND